jgi:hypothetical protein
MARPPNYSFERSQRERAKEEKATLKAAATRELREQQRLQAASGENGAPDDDQKD